RHARLARRAGGDDDHIRAGGVGVVVRPDDVDVEAFDRAGLEQVQPFALRHALDDIHQDDVAELLGGDPVRGRRPDEAGADDGYLGAHVISFGDCSSSSGGGRALAWSRAVPPHQNQYTTISYSRTARAAEASREPGAAPGVARL